MSNMAIHNLNIMHNPPVMPTANGVMPQDISLFLQGVPAIEDAAIISALNSAQTHGSRKGFLARMFDLLKKAIGKKSFKADTPVSIGVLSLSGMGGSGNVARLSAQALAKAGHRVFLFCARDAFFPKEDIPDVSLLHINVPHEPRAPDVSWVSSLAHELSAAIYLAGIDIVHVHYVAGLLEAALLAKQSVAEKGRAVKVIATLHGSDVLNYGKHPIYGHALAKQLFKSDKVSAVSEWLASEAQKIFGMREAPIVIKNSVDVERFKPQDEEYEGIRQCIAPDGERVLCHASNFRPVKRAADTVEIHAHLRSEGIPTKLLLMGNGPDLDKAHDRAKKLGVSDSIVSTGALAPSEIARYTAASDLALVTSEFESFSLAALEALSCGVPVVGARCGGLDEVVGDIGWKVDGFSRLLAGVGDTQAMAMICAELLRNAELYFQIQMQGIKAPLSRFHADHQTQGYLDLVDSVL